MKRLGLLLSISLLFALSLAAADGESKREATAAESELKAGATADGTDAGETLLLRENRSIEGLVEEVTSDGARRVDLRNRFRHALVLRIEPDGRRMIHCADTAEQLEALLDNREVSSVEETEGE